MACATVRAFAKVKSSAMTPRQPSVPNLIEDMGAGKSIRDAKHSQNSRIGLLEEVFPALRFEPFHDFSHILGTVAWTNQQRIGSAHHYKTTHAERGQAYCRRAQQATLT